MPELGGQNFSYPQAPQPNQGFLGGDPSKMIDVLGGLQRLQILGQQAPALGQIPGQELSNLKTQQVNAQMQQQADVRQRYLTALANSFTGNADPHDIQNFSVNYSRQNPVDAANFPDIINGVTSQVINDPKGVGHGLTQAQLQTLTPGQATTPSTIGYVPGTAQPVTGTGAQLVERARGGGVLTTPPPGTEIGAGAYQQEQLADSASYNTDTYNIKKAYALANQINGLGVGTAERAHLESALISLAPSIWPDAMKEHVSNVQQLEKFLQRNISATAQTFGPHTNAGLSQATTGNPNMNITDMALPQLLQSSLIVRNMQHAQIAAAAETGGPGGYAAAKRKFVGNQDPEAYALDMMTPQQIQNLQKTLTGADRQRFNRSLIYAIKSGAVTHPDPKTQAGIEAMPWPTQ